MKKIIIVLTILIIGCSVYVETEKPIAEESISDGSKVTLFTDDGFYLKGDLIVNNNVDKYLLLLHQLGSDRSSWNNFIAKAKEDYTILNLDLRGHGDSIKKYNQQLSWKQFAPNDFKQMPNDIDKAIEYLMDNGLNGGSYFAIVGASIGANSAIHYLTDHTYSNMVDAVVALSPGLDYKGIDISSKELKKDILIIYSQGDSYSAMSSENIKTKFETENSRIDWLQGKSHGTKIFEDYPLMIDYTIQWLNGNVT